MRVVSSLAMAAAVLGLSACAPDIDIHGNAPTPDRLAQIKPGLTKPDVLALLGSPSETATFGDDSWYYISSRIVTVAVFAPKEIERGVVVITFNREGEVQGVRQLDLDDGKQVAINGTTTPTAGREMGVIEQLVGNVGRFNKEPDSNTP